MLDIKITKNTAPKAKPADESQLGFAKIFTDHMFLMDYAEGQGWHGPGALRGPESLPHRRQQDPALPP